METAEYDVAVIGGGILGSCIAMFVKLMDASKKVVLLERSSIGSGATGMSAGTIWSAGFSKSGRNTLSNMTAKTLKLVQEIEAAGYDCGFQQCGALQIATSEESAEDMRKVHAELRADHSDIELISPDTVAKMEPALALGQCNYGALYTPFSGFVDPMALVCAVCDRFSDHGGHIIEGLEVKDIIRRQNSYTLSCHTQHARMKIRAKKLVVATGVSLPSLARLVGAEAKDVDIQPVHGYITHHSDFLPRLNHVIFGLEAGLHWRKTGGIPLTHVEGERQTDHLYAKFVEGTLLVGGPRILDPEKEERVALRDHDRFVRKIFGAKGIEDDCGVTSGVMPFTTTTTSSTFINIRVNDDAFITGGLSSKGIMCGVSMAYDVAEEICACL